MIANGNGDSVDTLAALSLAVKSDWTLNGKMQRHVIVVLTDAPVQKLEEANRSNPYYLENIPASLEDLTDIWFWNNPAVGPTSKFKLKQKAKRLIVFAPLMSPWLEIYESWNRVVYYPSVNDILSDLFYEDVFNCIFADV